MMIKELIAEKVEEQEIPDVNWVIFAVTSEAEIRILAYDFSDMSFQDDVSGYIDYSEDGNLDNDDMNGKVYKSVWTNDFTTDYWGETDGGWLLELEGENCKEIAKFL